MNSNPRSTTVEPCPNDSILVLGARLTWVMVGPVALLGLTYAIVSRGTGWLTGFDAAFAIVAGLMLLGRWVEQRSGTATTIKGQPATFEQLKRYVAILMAVAAGVWIVANLLGNHLLQ